MAHYYICHSAKGTTWKKHKYLKKIGDTYVYAKKAVGDLGKKIGNISVYSETKSRGITIKGQKTKVINYRMNKETVTKNVRVKDLVKSGSKAINKVKDSVVDVASSAYKTGMKWLKSRFS